MNRLGQIEKTGLPFASTVVTKDADGNSVSVAHACGHDLHMSAWFGTAKLMAESREQWHGTLMLVGQPAEETVKGAAAMIKDGLFTRFPKPNFALSMHDESSLPAGQVGFHSGFFRASSDAVDITIFGVGGHGAAPQDAVDPIVIAAQTVLALQTIVSRENNPMDPAVTLSVPYTAAQYATSFRTRSSFNSRFVRSTPKPARNCWLRSRESPKAKPWLPVLHVNRWLRLKLRLPLFSMIQN